MQKINTFYFATACRKCADLLSRDGGEKEQENRTPILSPLANQHEAIVVWCLDPIRAACRGQKPIHRRGEGEPAIGNT